MGFLPVILPYFHSDIPNSSDLMAFYIDKADSKMKGLLRHSIVDPIFEHKLHLLRIKKREIKHAVAQSGPYY